jgi:dTDP-4-amino-4,6-dideoxygalactose transaminase
MSSPDITELEVRAVTEVLHSGHLSLGPKLEAFEREFAAYVGTRHAIGVSSGTAGLHLAVLAAGIGRDDLVLTTPFSFVASSNCLLYAGAEPVFVDVDPVTGTMDVQLLEATVSAVQSGRWSRRRRSRRRRSRGAGKLAAIIPIHVFGQPAGMDGIGEIARQHGLVVIEDACEAIGSEYNGRQAGRLGDVGVFGFYPNKQMTTGEGGMVVTDRDDWAACIRSQRNQGRDAMDAWLRHDRLGFNYRLNELSAALGVVQLARLDGLIAARARVVGWYEERLALVPGVITPERVPTTTRMSWFAYVVRLAPGVDRDAVMNGLAERGIPSRTYFTPIHLQPFYRQQFGYEPGDFPVAEALGRASLALPFSSTMSEAQVDRVCSEVARLTAFEPTSVARDFAATT